MFCFHKYQFVRNLYGYDCKANNYNRSIWKCEKCGKRKRKSRTYRKA